MQDRRLIGICPPVRALFIAEWMATQDAPLALVVAEDEETLGQLAEDTLLFWRTAKNTHPLSLHLFPAAIQSRDMRESFNRSADRAQVLEKLRQLREHPDESRNERHIVFATPDALLQPLPALKELASNTHTLKRGQQQSFTGLLETLRSLDYDSEIVCEGPGHYAVRGGIIDIYPITASEPCRLDFFGDQIDDIHVFDPVSQRSGKRLESVTISPSPRLGILASEGGISDYLPANTNILFIEPSALEEQFDLLSTDSDAPAPSQLELILAHTRKHLSLSQLEEPLKTIPSGVTESWQAEALSHYRRYPLETLVAEERLDAEEGLRGEFLRQLETWQHDGYRLAVATANDSEENRAKEILKGDAYGKKLRSVFIRGNLNEGFLLSLPEDSAKMGILSALTHSAKNKKALAAIKGIVLVTRSEIFGRHRNRQPRKSNRLVAQRTQVDQLLDFSELVEGDYVVHLQHGIAHYRGLKSLETSEGMREVISLEFDDGVQLHVPLQESHLITRYVGLAKTRPQLGKIGSNRWEKTRRAAETATIDLAAELLRIQAMRQAQPGHAFPPDNDWQREFEAAFPYTETPDQLTAIKETKSDMERSRPMDRLICGDVGYGKTEVAIRAAFKAVQDGRQVAVLVPTTVLAQQHLNTFRERMSAYPVSIEMLSRFGSRKDHTRILAAAAKGRIDILIGTHRIIQPDVSLPNLGLLVIDEEQRFGVKHKEQLKRFRASVDVLSMSATPIPRTLYMAMTGAREMSVIQTAPVNRHPIQTIVKTYDEKVVTEAILHETRRGGQVFYLHNRVQTIDIVANRLRQLLPDLRIAVGHGQMKDSTLEKVMTEFVAQRYDVLVCTTIIESGLDIPNCNTIIIEGADRFGLSQLYQLRGRVGRFHRQAYAYLLLHRHAHLLNIARERLAALRTHNQLGAGFRIAMRDLELRGAGNLLGSQQSGHIVGVGFSLYCQLLQQSVSRLKGEKQAANIRTALKLDFVAFADGSPDSETPSKRKGRHEDAYTITREEENAPPIETIHAYLPQGYIGESNLRIDIYRRLAIMQKLEEVKDMEAELRDRFGKFGDAVRALLLVAEIRILASQKQLVSVQTESTKLKCLKATGKHDDFIMIGSRFPRLTERKPLLRLKEIISFLSRLPNS